MGTGDEPTTHQLRLALALAEERHFGRAAERVFLTQPAFSQQIRSLERRLGVALFSRTSRRVELTDAGRSLLPLARTVVDGADRLRGAARTASGRDHRLRVSVCESFAALDVVRRVVAALDDPGGPGAVVTTAESAVEQVALLEAGSVDAMFTYLPVPDDLEALPLGTEARRACVSADDPLADRRSIRLADLSGYPVVGLAPSTPAAARAFWAAVPRPDRAAVRVTDDRASRMDSVLSAVAVRRSVAFVPASAARLYPRPDVAHLTVDDLGPCTFALVRRADASGDPRKAVVESVCRRVRTGSGAALALRG